MSFRDNYQSIAERLLQRPLVGGDGVSDDVISAGAADIGGSIPLALRDYYTVIGNLPFNQAHNRLAAPDELAFDCEEQSVVFMVENQSVCAWGIKVPDLTVNDPIAYQGQPDDGDWYSEECTLSEFLIVTLYLQCCSGGLKFTGSHMQAEEALPQIRETWDEVVNHNGLTVWHREGMLVSYMGMPWCNCAANTKALFDTLQSNYGFSED